MMSSTSSVWNPAASKVFAYDALPPPLHLMHSFQQFKAGRACVSILDKAQ